MLYFIINEGARSGKGKLVWEQIKGLIDNRQLSYQCYKTKYIGHARKLASMITSESSYSDLLITVGGDGTVNEVINGIQDFQNIRLGVIPVGSGNDYARGLSLTSDPLCSIKHLLDRPEEMTIDLGKVSWNSGSEQRLFAISSGIGLDALVSKKALTSRLKKILNKVHLGKLTYLILTIETLFSMDTANMDLIFDNKHKLHLSKTIFLAAMNFKAEGGGVPMAPQAEYLDGKLDFSMAYGIPKWKTFLLLPFLVAARHENIHGFRIIKRRYCLIHADKPMVVHTDGEYCGTFTDVEYTCLKNILHIIK